MRRLERCRRIQLAERFRRARSGGRPKKRSIVLAREQCSGREVLRKVQERRKLEFGSREDIKVSSRRVRDYSANCCDCPLGDTRPLSGARRPLGHRKPERAGRSESHVARTISALFL